jgi:pSer/pThr/pTyr-binding forkhead associated (FHA) protein
VVESVELIIKQPGQADRVVRLQEGATRMGRAEDNEVVLSDVGVSRRHAQVYVSRGEVTVEDLGSGNGTYYNGYRIQSQPVSDGDEIVVDPFVLEFRIRGQSAGRSLDQGEVAPARLEVVVGSGMAGSSYPITSRGLSIGRAEDRDVVIPDPAASRHHTQISLQSGEYVLRDMGSANGVFVNAVRVRECTLADGDLVRIGNTEMRFVRYHNDAGDHTTQVVPGEQWQGGWEEPPPKKGRGGMIAAFLFFVIVAVSIGVAVLAAALLIVVLVAMQPGGPPAFPQDKPAWRLVLPGALPAESLDALAESGRTKMAGGDRRGALQDFYRILDTDPNRFNHIDNFAFASGEGMVMELLGAEAARLDAERVRVEKHRDDLLARARRSGRVARDAKRELERDYRDDPVVIDHFGWKATDGMVAIEKKAAEGRAKVTSEPDGAVAPLREVLANAREPALRKQALASLEQAYETIAAETAADYTEAIMLVVTGETELGKAKLASITAEHPAHVGAQLRLAEL